MLVIAGSGTDSRYGKLIRQQIASSRYSHRIFAVGHVSREKMLALYRRCSLCVIATEVEACPTIAIEAMSSGCVILSSNQPPLPEIFAGCSMEFRTRDIADLAAKIRQCMYDDALRKTLKELALKRAQDFSWSKCAVETYRALVDWPKRIDHETPFV
jgi:alpha-1,3-rhamnosyl/mannosyltransferase